MATVPKNFRTVIIAASVGNVIEWYDFYIFGSLAAVLSVKFFKQSNPTGDDALLRSRADEECCDADNRDHHEGGGIGENDLGRADFGDREKIDDLELVNRIGHDLRAVLSIVTHDAGRAHHVQNAGDEAEQQKHDQSPRRDA